jgi:hypothetical protein
MAMLYNSNSRRGSRPLRGCRHRRGSRPGNAVPLDKLPRYLNPTDGTNIFPRDDTFTVSRPQPGL